MCKRKRDSAETFDVSAEGGGRSDSSKPKASGLPTIAEIETKRLHHLHFPSLYARSIQLQPRFVSSAFRLAHIANVAQVTISCEDELPTAMYRWPCRITCNTLHPPVLDEGEDEWRW